MDVTKVEFCCEKERRLRVMEEENSRLKRLVADQAVQIQIMKEVNAKNGKPVNQAAGSQGGGRASILIHIVLEGV